MSDTSQPRQALPELINLILVPLFDVWHLYTDEHTWQPSG
jgi:hypothetical protein